MAWNRPSENAGANRKPAASRSRGKLIGTGLVLAVVSGVVVWLLCGHDSPSHSTEAKSGKSRIAEATPSIPRQPPQTNAAPKEREFKIPDSVKPDEHGILRYPSGMRWLDPRRPVVKVKNETREGRLFKHSSERIIAGVIETEPGATVFGTFMYPKNFKEDFLKALEEPIEYDKEDSLEDRQLKIAVEQSKRELKERMDAGEDPVQILKETREELKRLGAYRDDLRKQVNEFIKDEKYTDQDIEDFTKAANQMLEKEGLPPLKSPHTIVRQMMIRRAKEEAAKQAAKEAQEAAEP